MHTNGGDSWKVVDQKSGSIFPDYFIGQAAARNLARDLNEHDDWNTRYVICLEEDAMTVAIKAVG